MLFVYVCDTDVNSGFVNESTSKLDSLDSQIRTRIRQIEYGLRSMTGRTEVNRVTFKLCLIIWKTFHTAHPPYLSELITHYRPSRALPSSNTNLLARPSGIADFTSRAFSVSAPSTWNSLPAHIHSVDKLSTFKRQLKSHLFQSAFAV